MEQEDARWAGWSTSGSHETGGRKTSREAAHTRCKKPMLKLYRCPSIGTMKKNPLTQLFLALFLSLPLVSGQLISGRQACRKQCVCASDIISCSGVNLTYVPVPLPKYTSVLDLSFNAIGRLRAEWTPVPLNRLRTLLLAHNSLNFLSSEAFAYVTEVRYLDLSSNELRQLDESIFGPLNKLEVLLLYRNLISQIDRSAFSDLENLQRIYLSQNQISRFPLELVKERTRLPKITVLDVSSNRIKTLTAQELGALPAWVANGLYFHDNPLPCSCDLFHLVARWQLKGLSSVVDFKSEHTCVLADTPKQKVPTLDLHKAYLNCSQVKTMDREAYLEQSLVLDCDTKQRNVEKSWVLPGNATASTLPDGNLQLGPLKEDDSGVYTCYAISDVLNETLYFTVVVFNATADGGMENLKTAYTTLIACLVSIVMVFIYLYLTPCQGPCCPGHDPEKNDPAGSLRSFVVSIAFADTETAAEQGGRDLAKDLMEQNGRLNPLSETRRTSVSSVSSDTPMVV
ncbi:amphoterin-induced protein 1-like isoform X2 [Nerophis ophidion]|uniref:amphoterin-induced protein 1-like isoform X2 n=1 Tax=Nerophis ophidion TaxID=159077 RepID=UPI002AE07959|nr:amphoterin-induced protein 1-like isoform X2 [Nerophis ophidion]